MQITFSAISVIRKALENHLWYLSILQGKKKLKSINLHSLVSFFIQWNDHRSYALAIGALGQNLSLWIDLRKYESTDR